MGLTRVTELSLAAARGRVTDRGDYVVVETPDEPGWSDGNYLLLPRAPRADEIAEHARRFEHELGTHRVVSLRWDEPTGAHYDGFTVDTYEMMAADDVLAPVHALAMRELAADELPATAELAWAIGDRHDDAYHQFLRRRASWQATVPALRFYGAFDGRALVASLGLFEADGIARYQEVQTHASQRRRGLAGALLATAARAASAARFAILAAPGSDAQRVYARVGFVTVERTARAYRARK